MRGRAMCTVVLGGLSLLAGAAMAVAQEATSQYPSDTALCTFEDGKQITVRYNRPTANEKEKLPLGKLWLPGDSPMFLFTETPIIVAGTEIPIGAYAMYTIPGKSDWTLIINKNVTAGSAYDQQQDLVRAPMEIGQLSQPEKKFTVYFGRMTPKQCSMRLDFGKTRAFIDFNEK